MDAEQRSVFQGIVYYYRENMVNCRYQVTLKDAVDAAFEEYSRTYEESLYCIGSVVGPHPYPVLSLIHI